MAGRYHGRAYDAARSSSRPSDGLGESWIGLGAIALTLIGAVAVAWSGESSPGSSDRMRSLAATLAPAERSLASIESAFGSLCEEPLLIGLELAPDCETGVMTLPDGFYSGGANARIRPEAREFMAAAMTTYLTRLRQLPALWKSLEAIEIRGHAGPPDARGRGVNPLFFSQQRALSTLLFLTGPGGINDEEDRRELERLAIASGSAAARPPPSCPEPSTECLPHWRRVEIRPVLSEPLRRGDWARTIESVRVSTAGRARPAAAQQGPTR